LSSVSEPCRGYDTTYLQVLRQQQQQAVWAQQQAARYQPSGMPPLPIFFNNILCICVYDHERLRVALFALRYFVRS
jgi:hypothetical protein